MDFAVRPAPMILHRSSTATRNSLTSRITPVSFRDCLWMVDEVFRQHLDQFFHVQPSSRARRFGGWVRPFQPAFFIRRATVTVGSARRTQTSILSSLRLMIAGLWIGS
jgi:hypothetical protein